MYQFVNFNMIILVGLIKGGLAPRIAKDVTMKAKVQPISSPELEEEKEEPNTQLQDLRSRIIQLENAFDSSQYSIGIINEFLNILSRHAIGKQIVNRAVNLYKLNQLRYVVLPRRKIQLQEISEQPMPKGIRDSFVKRELVLIKNATRAINKRAIFEKKACESLQQFFDKLVDLNKHAQRSLSQQ